jgi:hypothetical protein
MHNKHRTIEELLETLFSVGSEPRLYGELPLEVAASSSWQSGRASEYSQMASVAVS